MLLNNENMRNFAFLTFVCVESIQLLNTSLKGTNEIVEGMYKLTCTTLKNHTCI